jgi:uncharacterized protein (TIGR00304 family)
MLLFFLGIILIILGLAIMFSPMVSPKPVQEIEEKDDRGEPKTSEYKHKVKGGAIIMIGPLPIVVGSDSKTASFLMILALIIMIFWFLILTQK